MFFKGIFYFRSLIAICAFARLRFCASVLLVLLVLFFVLLMHLVLFCAFGAFGQCKNFSYKNNKEFKTAKITSFILLLKFFIYLNEFYIIEAFKYFNIFLFILCFYLR